MKKVLLQCLEKAGGIIRKGFGKAHRIRKKAPVSLVTEIDMAADRAVISIIRKHFPGHAILTEESVPSLTGSPYRWIIDPLDGTTNFAHEIPLCGVSIAVEHRGDIILGGIFNPILNELYFTEKGGGAWLNGRRLAVSRTGVLLDSLLVTGFPYDRREKAHYYLKFHEPLLAACQGVRRLGAAALDLAYVAAGRFEAFWEMNLQPWDIAAGILLVEEAGGRVTDYSGGPIDVDRPGQILASNGRIHPSLQKIFKKIINSPLTK
ncbi:MAG: hypothetical protein A2902_03925 [Elusimicrobia bacterium RIFCSPLOWO2_01_FULL_64_13]|nr:MAG: hypothetical protein A2636_02890 [Elusimicrobia bacterium RIFCSPHIGHO2_01_FULL_64_10]OGR97313.1 MAG: hypothetical protein A2902_03925 [Elusimicrobia bacterium RIFCSPLOWO2_01_FULL_64_13]